MLWTDLCAEHGFRVLVPHRPGVRPLSLKEVEVRRKHRIPENVPILFLEVHPGDTSEFQNNPVISVRQESGRCILEARQVVSVPHTIAQIAIELGKQGHPLDIIFGRSLGSSLWLAVDYVLFGQGDVPNNVVDLLERAVPAGEKRPEVIVG